VAILNDVTASPQLGVNSLMTLQSIRPELVRHGTAGLIYRPTSY